MTTDNRSRIERVRRALEEVQANKHVFSTETYTQIILALMDKQRALQTRPTDGGQPVEADTIRLVTVMFVDIKDSTELAQQLDSETWKSVLDLAHQKMAEVIAQSEGEIGQYLGDGLLCFFGAHRSRGDDAVRAVAAALSIQQAMLKYASDVQQSYQIDFAVRIGISTGRLVVGMVGGGGKQEFLALGPATNLAARLQTICPPSGVLIDSPTYQRVRNNFIITPQSPVQLKGFDEPIAYYSVEGYRRRSATQLTRTRIADVELPFIGRQVELAAFEEVWQNAIEEEQFRAITYFGNIGQGKSRLLQEILNRAAEFPATQICLVAQYEQRTTPYNLIHNLLVSNCNINDTMPVEEVEQRIYQFIKELWDGDDHEAVAAIMGYLAGLGFEDSEHVVSLKQGGEGQERLAYRRIAQLFEYLAESSALLLVVDNLHWADEYSLDWLEYLAQALSQESAVLISSARPEFREIRPNFLQQIPAYRAFDITPLSLEETQQLVDTILQQVENVPAKLSEIISERAGGNPLFVEELLNMLFDNGVFEQIDEGRWKINHYRYTTTLSTLPSGLLNVLQARLDDLPPAARHIAQVAAVIGYTFWDTPLCAILNVEDVDNELKILEDRGIISISQESDFPQTRQYYFRHSLYRDVAYEMLTRTNREQFHRLIADWLHNYIEHHPKYLADLAEHYQQGGMYEEALETYLNASLSHWSGGLLKEVLTVVEHGLGLARNVPRERALPIVSRMWVLRARTLNALNRYEEASAASASAQRLLEELSPDLMLEERIEAALTLGEAYRSMGQFQDALQALLQAYELVQEGDTASHISVLSAFGALYLYQGDLAQSAAYFQRAFNLARSNEEPDRIPYIMTNLGMIAQERGELAIALNYYERVLEMNRKRGNLYFQILDLRNIGSIYRELFAYEQAQAVLEEAYTLQDYIQFEDPLTQVNQALVWISLGRKQEGLSLLEQAQQIESPSLATQFNVRLAYIQGLAMLGEYQACKEEAQQFIEAATNNAMMRARGRLWLGIAGHALGDENAIGHLRKALQDEQTYAGKELWRCYAFLAFSAQSQEKARQYYEKAASIISTLSTSLVKRPDLQISLLNNEMVQIIFASSRTQ